MRDWLGDAQRAAEDHIGAVWDYWNEAESAMTDAEIEDLGPDPAIGPFCGCTTCEVREILHAAVPLIAAGIAAGDVDVNDLVELPHGGVVDHP